MTKIWKAYSKSPDRKDEINDKVKTAGRNASAEAKQLQKAESRRHGGALGETGRMLAHYSGALVNPKDTLMRGRAYNTPQSNLDISRIGDGSLVDTNVKGRANANKDEDTKRENTKNGIPSFDEIEGLGTSRRTENTDRGK